MNRDADKTRPSVKWQCVNDVIKKDFEKLYLKEKSI